MSDKVKSHDWAMPYRQVRQARVLFSGIQGDVRKSLCRVRRIKAGEAVVAVGFLSGLPLNFQVSLLAIKSTQMWKP